MHDVAWVSNPYSPYTPGEREGGEAPPETAARDSGGMDGSGTDGGIGAGSGLFPREDEDGTKAPGLRIPAAINRRNRRVARD